MSCSVISQAPPAYTEIAQDQLVKGHEQVWDKGKNVCFNYNIYGEKVFILTNIRKYKNANEYTPSIWFKKTGEPLVYNIQGKTFGPIVKEYKRLQKFYQTLKDKGNTTMMLHTIHIAKKMLHKKDKTNPQVEEAMMRWYKRYAFTQNYPK